MSVGPWQILVVLVIVILIFGGKRLKNLGSDLGESLKGFKKAMKEEDKPEEITKDKDKDESVVKTEAKHKDDTKG